MPEPWEGALAGLAIRRGEGAQPEGEEPEDGVDLTELSLEDLLSLRVTSAGEDRHPDNQPVLAGGNDPYGQEFGY